MITNERVKELLKQAECVVEGDGYGDGNIELLIQLVVRKSAKIADSNDNGSTDEWDLCARNISRNIKEHFGVEE